jgi:hypothetical protein
LDTVFLPIDRIGELLEWLAVIGEFGHLEA